MTPKHSFMIVTVALAAMLAGVWLAVIDREQDSNALMLPNQALKLFPNPKQLTAFSLTDHKDHAFDLASLKGKWSFLFFGFTHCPDVCPTTLLVLARTHEFIAKSKVGIEGIQFVFISVDPNRDTAVKLKQYVEYFDSTFLGVTGNDGQIAKLAALLGAEYRIAFKPGEKNYPVYHTSAVFLVNPRAHYHAILIPPHDAETISRRFNVLRAFEEEKAR